MLIKYEGPKSQTLVLAGSGTGGINELAGHLSNDNVGYGLVRKTDRIDDSETVKFAFILFLGEKVGIMQKARISVHAGAVKDVIGQFHIDIATSAVDDLTEEALVRKIQDTSGSGTRVLDESGARMAKTASNSSKPTIPRSVSGSGSSDNVALPSKDGIQELRAGNINWILYTSDQNKLSLLGQGNGGTDELVQHLQDDIVAYGLVRLIERVDESDTVKFAFISWVGDNIPRMLRARLGTHSGAVKEFFHPYHVDINATQKSEVSEDIVMDKVKRAAGTAVHVRDTVGGPHSTSRYSSTTHTPTSSSQARSTPIVAKQVQGITIKDEADLRAAIQDVRSDASSTNWAAATYDGANSSTVVLLGKGSGGVEELISHLRDDIVAYGLVRIVEEFDLSQNVRFVFVNWVGENINRMFRAKLGTHSGAVKEIFSPYHVDLHPTNKSEISADILSEKVRHSMGTAQHVREL